MILVGRVLGCEDSPGPPLAFWRGSYRRLAVHRDGSVREEGRPVPVAPWRLSGREPVNLRGPDSVSVSDGDHELMCAEIARLVMDWTATDIPWAYDGVTSVWHTAEGDPVMTVFSWRPDRNDAQTMQVLDRMLELGFGLTLTARGGRTAVQFSRGSMAPARVEHCNRRIALLRAALAGIRGAVE